MCTGSRKLYYLNGNRLSIGIHLCADAGLVPARMQMRPGLGTGVRGRWPVARIAARKREDFQAWDKHPTVQYRPLQHDDELSIISDKKPNTRTSSPESILIRGRVGNNLYGESLCSQLVHTENPQYRRVKCEVLVLFFFSYVWSMGEFFLGNTSVIQTVFSFFNFFHRGFFTQESEHSSIVFVFWWHPSWLLCFDDRSQGADSCACAPSFRREQRGLFCVGEPCMARGGRAALRSCPWCSAGTDPKRRHHYNNTQP